MKQSDYEALQKENQQLQQQLDQASERARQAQVEIGVQQGQLLQLAGVQAKLQKTEELLQHTQDDLAALKAEFDKFCIQRRNAMLGKKYPTLALDGGKVLREAEITAIVGDDVSIRHQDGVIKVALASSSEELRWEACYNPNEARMSARERLLAEARLIEANRKANSTEPETAPKPSLSASTSNPVHLLQSQLAAQRKELNAEFQTLAAKNPAAVRGVEWNTAAPEASPLLNTLSGSRAILGLSRLQSQRDSIYLTLRQLRELDPSAR